MKEKEIRDFDGFEFMGLELSDLFLIGGIIPFLGFCKGALIPNYEFKIFSSNSTAILPSSVGPLPHTFLMDHIALPYMN